MAPFLTNKELISAGIKEFNVLLNQQVSLCTLFQRTEMERVCAGRIEKVHLKLEGQWWHWSKCLETGNANPGKEGVSVCKTILALTSLITFSLANPSLVSPPHPQVFDDPLIPEENMVTVVDDWVKLYTNYYKKQMLGEQQEQDKALQELQQELSTLGSQFLTKYRTFLKSRESTPPSS